MIHVFVIDLDDPAFGEAQMRSWLSKDERLRGDAFATEQLARRFMAARLAMRIVLGKAVDRHPSGLAFTANAWGRPELPGGPYFNLTHTSGSALLAVDRDAAVGVDAEAATQTIDDGTMSEILSPEEAASLRAGDCSATRVWVRKEALLKAYGRGLSVDPKTLTVGWHAADTKNWRSVAVGENRDIHRLIDIDAGETMIASLARSGAADSDVSVVPFQWP